MPDVSMLSTLTDVKSQVVNTHACNYITFHFKLRHSSLSPQFAMMSSSPFCFHWFFIPQWVSTDQVSGWISV